MNITELRLEIIKLVINSKRQDDLANPIGMADKYFQWVVSLDNTDEKKVPDQPAKRPAKEAKPG